MTIPVRKGISAPAVTNVPEKWDRTWFRTFITNFLVNADIRNAVTGPGLIITGNVSGDTTATGGSNSVTITQSPVPNNTVMGNVSGISAVPIALNQTQLTTLVNVFTALLSGAVPASGGGTTNFLRADATWDDPIPAIANDTVLGNISGVVAPPVGLTETQLTTLVKTFTATTSGAVAAPVTVSGRFLRDDGTWDAVSSPTSANPSAQVGPTATNGSAATFMTSDSAPAINLSAPYSWSGSHTFSAVVNATVGLVVAGGNFISRGITDDGLTVALTIANTQAISTTAPTSGSSLTVNGNASGIAMVVVSGLSATTPGADVNIRRAGSTVNSVLEGASLDLSDSTNTTATNLQHSGGQFEMWQTQNNGVTWNQILKVLSTHGVVINAPTSGNGLAVTGASGSYAVMVQANSTASNSDGLFVAGGTNSSDNALRIQNATQSANYLGIRGDGSLFAGPSATNFQIAVTGGVSVATPSSGDSLTVGPSVTSGALIATSAALTNNAGTGAGTLTNAPAIGNPTKWIKINDNGTIRSIPAW